MQLNMNQGSTLILNQCSHTEVIEVDMRWQWRSTSAMIRQRCTSCP